MVIDLGSALAGDWGAVEADVTGGPGRLRPALLKVIVESAALTPSSSRGVPAQRGGRRAVRQDVHRLPPDRRRVGRGRSAHARDGRRPLGVKASGGIRDTATALAMLDAGASGSACRHPCGAGGL
jgi:deoxyribose-phosphate aldolase